MAHAPHQECSFQIFISSHPGIALLEAETKTLGWMVRLKAVTYRGTVCPCPLEHGIHNWSFPTIYRGTGCTTKDYILPWQVSQATSNELPLSPLYQLPLWHSVFTILYSHLMKRWIYRLCTLKLLWSSVVQIKLVWVSKWSPVKVLYFFVRYYSAVNLVYVLPLFLSLTTHPILIRY